MQLPPFRSFVLGVGLKAGSHAEEEVWNEFANDIPRLQQVASAIRSSAQTDDEEIQRVRLETDQDVEEAPEGTVLLRLHRVPERNVQLVRLRKEKTLDEFGSLPCEVCAFDFRRRYGELGEGFIECHHLKPLSLLVPGEKTRLTDLSLTCSNCHRVLHRGRPWPTLPDLRTRLSRPEYMDVDRFAEYVSQLERERSLRA